MNKEKQYLEKAIEIGAEISAIEELAYKINDVWDNKCQFATCNGCKYNNINDTKCQEKLIAEHLYNAGYRKQSEGELRVETITDDFTDMKIAEERGWYRKRFYCPNCDILIKTESWDRNYMFGCGTILKSNDMPNFCPNCGAKMKGGAE